MYDFFTRGFTTLHSSDAVEFLGVSQQFIRPPVTHTHTERRNHGRDVIKTYDLSSVDGIVIASGDGVLYEVIRMSGRKSFTAVLHTHVNV